MFPDLQHLIELQKLDTTIADAKQRIASHPERLKAADARLNDAQSVIEAARRRLKESQDARRALEKDAAVYQGRLTKFKDQQSAVKTNREYQALGHEIETAQQDLAAVEEKEIALMVEADVIVLDLKQAEALFAAQQKEIENEKKAMVEERAAVEASLTHAQGSRAGLVARLPANLVALFEQVARVRKGVGVCAAADGLCSICRMRLRPHVYQQVRRNDSIIQCESCHRILFFVPPPAPAEPPVTHAP